MFSVVITGRFNVGKSTLFNSLVGKRIAVESDKPGTTRDYIEAYIDIEGYKIKLIDTGGFEFNSKDPLYNEVKNKTLKVIKNASLILFVVDRHNIIEEDINYLKIIKKLKKDYILILNKADKKADEIPDKEIFSLGVKNFIFVSSINKYNIDLIEEEILKFIKKSSYTIFYEKDNKDTEIKVVILGRPNVGKSSFFNSIINDQRTIVSEIPGTTVDSIEETISFEGLKIKFIDTAGIRRKKSIKENVEFYSIQRAFDSVDRADIVLLMVDYPDLIKKQDKKIADYIIKKGKPFILIVNKIDLFEGNVDDLEDEIDYLFPHIKFVKRFFISAKEKRGIGKIFKYIKDLYGRLNQDYKTSELNKYIENCKNTKQILIGKSYLNLLYSVVVSKFPLTFLIFVNKNPKDIPSYYTDFLINRLRKEFNLESIPVKIKYKKRE
ncbi:MAG: ribosome biogenesis GTPase Der [Spirochaetes bacterium]|nr:ribosome biogenesis GTPase Der [Spirochaetota bacterium]